ncbi:MULTISPECIES: hypothetical protein [Corynebacterium]|uniref:hypothetical protein n=1 Tax=Corynebacterium TaxID=1716 RepID=UPI00195E69CB|nr:MULTISPECIES: hypothetical protein [Corynebacterium]MDN8623865.1 hypothetical protein [Corynebacterium kroppenstedtii]QRQ64318.1 hypothetical protein I6J23_06755 [Corynebacterium kroppenstedtii]
MPIIIEHGVARDLFTFMSRAEHLDSAALVRIHPAVGGACQPNAAGTAVESHDQRHEWFDIYVTTPLGPFGLRRIRAVWENDSAQSTVADSQPNVAEGVRDIITHCSNVRRAIDAMTHFHSPQGGPITLSLERPGTSGMWPGPVPLTETFTHVDDVIMDTVATLFNDVRDTAEAESGPAGIAQSLLDQKVMTVESSTAEQTAQLTSRAIIALGSLGFIGGDVMRVSVSPLWVRADTRLGTVLAQRRHRLNLLNM